MAGGPLFLVEKAFAMQGLTIATLVLVGWLLLRRRFRLGALILLVMLAVRELSGYTKALFGGHRPAWQDFDFLHHAGSYPSGRAAGVATLAGLVIVLAIVGRRSRPHLRPVAVVTCVVVVAVCADRLLLGRHYRPTCSAACCSRPGSSARLGAAPAARGRRKGRHPCG